MYERSCILKIDSDKIRIQQSVVHQDQINHCQQIRGGATIMVDIAIVNWLVRIVIL